MVVHSLGDKVHYYTSFKVVTSIDHGADVVVQTVVREILLFAPLNRRYQEGQLDSTSRIGQLILVIASSRVSRVGILY